MANVREVHLTQDPFSHWANNVKDAVSERSLINSPDFLGFTDSRGSHLRLHPKHKYTPTDYMSYAKEYNCTASYTKGDMVRVLHDRTYDFPWTSKQEYISN